MLSTIESGVVEGTWEEISNHASEFNGHRLRVIILPDPDQLSLNERLSSLKAWLSLPRPEASPLLDDSRSAIYDNIGDRG